MSDIGLFTVLQSAGRTAPARKAPRDLADVPAFIAKGKAAESLSLAEKLKKETGAAPDWAKQLEAQQQETDALARKLKQGAVDPKEEAARKVEEAKRKLKLLELQAQLAEAAGDKKAAARIAKEAARLAKEVGGAAKQYVEAGGEEPAAGDPGSLRAVARGAAPAGGGTEADAAATEAQAQALAASAGGQAEDGDAATQDAAEVLKDGTVPLTPEERREVLDRLAAERRREQQEREGDLRFVEEARSLLGRAKSLVERMRALVERRDGENDPGARKEVADAGKEVAAGAADLGDASAAALGTGGFAPGTLVNLSA